MTAPISFPNLPGAQPYDENRLRAFLRRIKPFTPAVRIALHRVFDRQQEFALALQQYERNTALTGVPDYSRLKRIIPEFAQARREALIALGEDPDTSNLLPVVPVIREDA